MTPARRAADAAPELRETETMASRAPVRTLTDLAQLDEAEIIDGYWDGRAGEPEPGDNRSRSYWHGWRNGRADGGHGEGDAAMHELARVFIGSGAAGTIDGAA